MSVDPDKISLSDLLAKGVAELHANGIEDPRLDARLLLQHVTGLSHASLISDSSRLADSNSVVAYVELVARRCQHEPVHRIIGARDFYGHRFALSKEALEPRSETELLVDAAIELGQKSRSFRFADVGTGSGAIAISVLKALPHAHAVACDISPGALKCAKGNAARLGCDNRMEFVCSNYTDALDGSFDLIVCNPPYIRVDEFEGLQTEVRLHDPAIALVSGPTGLEAYEAVLGDANRLLNDKGNILFEIGLDQGAAIRALAQAMGYVNCGSRTDLNGIERVLHFAPAPMNSAKFL